MIQNSESYMSVWMISIKLFSKFRMEKYLESAHGIQSASKMKLEQSSNETKIQLH